MCSVSFSYDNDEKTGRALKDVSFFVNKGERVAILGHNGSGKSTLVKILGGLLFPYDGACILEGTDIQDMEFKKLHSKIGMVFQDPENQIVAAMVEDDIAFAPENQGLPSDEIQLRVDMALAATNLLHKQAASVDALSGGEKQRVAIAGALAAQVDCLVLDEPTAMLDPMGVIKIEKVLRFLHNEGLTIIQITHQIEEETFSDIQKVIVLSEGQVAWLGSTHEFWDKAEDLGFALPDSFKIKKFFELKGINPQFLTTKNFHLLFTEKNTEKKSEIKFKIENLSFKYDEKIYALENINSEIFSGQWLSIIGRTGSGKSTLVQHLNALYKIQEGRIFFDGENLPQKGKEVYKLRQEVGLVFQNPEDQLFSSTVRDELAFAPKNAGFRNSELDEAILYGLDCVGLDRNFLERNPIALSGGEKRLVAIASVLSAKPECIVLDEPLAGLDASYQRKILAMLGKLRDSGKTVITITHDLYMALNCSDRILFLRNSRKISEGTPNEILEELINSLEPEALPDVLRISAEIHKNNKNFPLFYNYQDFISCLQEI